MGWYRSPDWYIHTANNEALPCNVDEMKSAVNGHFVFDQAEISRDLDQMLATGLV